MNKKIVTAAAIAAMTVSTAFADGEITVSVNGENVVFDQPPVIENDRTLVPMRAIFEALGATVEWDGETRTVTSTKADTTIKLTIESADMYVDDAVVTLDVPAKIINDRTMVPVRAISEAMDCVVEWDGEARAVIITTEADAAAAPEATAAPSTGGSSSSVSKYDEVAAQEGVNTYVPALVVGAIDPATGELVENPEKTTTDFAPVNGGKQYFADIYHPNAQKYTGVINAYAFYDKNKNFISGGTTSMKELVTAPAEAAYIRYTLDIRITSRNTLYVNFMQTSTAPTEFTKSEVIAKEAKTDAYEAKSIYMVGDSQITNGSGWTTLLDKALNANLLYINGQDGLRYTAQTGIALAADSFIATLPKSGYETVIVNAGTYDWMMNMKIADFEKAVTTFATKAKKQFGSAEIYVMTLPTVYYPGGFEDGITNGEGHTSADYSAVIKAVAEKNGFKVIDIAGLWTVEEAPTYLNHTDGDMYLFPNDKGCELISDAIVEALTN